MTGPRRRRTSPAAWSTRSAESGGDPNYRQFVAPDATLVPGSTGSWQCVEVDAAGNVIPGFSEGVNGGVTVPIGTRIRCTAFNQTARLHLAKTVTNDNGGTAMSPDWTLTATPTGTPPTGVVAQSVDGSVMGTDLFVLPGQEYSLTESGPAGLPTQSVLCSVGAAPPVDLRFIVLVPNAVATCTFANDDEAHRRPSGDDHHHDDGAGGTPASTDPPTVTKSGTPFGVTGRSVDGSGRTRSRPDRGRTRPHRRPTSTPRLSRPAGSSTGTCHGA